MTFYRGVDTSAMVVVVGLSVYLNDRPDWVRDSILSLLDQTFKRFKLAIYVDGPVDEKILTCISELSSSDTRITVFTSSARKGLAHGLNFLLRWGLERGAKYFFRMDSDDICYPERLERQIEFMEASPEIGVLGAGILEFDQTEPIVPEASCSRGLPLMHEEIVGGLVRYSTLNHPTVCFRYSCIASLVSSPAGLYNTEVGLAEDYRLWVELSLMGVRFANLPQVLLGFRISEDFYRRRSVKRAFSELGVRIYAMRAMGRLSIPNVMFAFTVLIVRLSPPPILRLVYKFRCVVR